MTQIEWIKRFREEYAPTLDTVFMSFTMEAFISSLLTEVINEIPDNVSEYSGRSIKQQLKKKYGIDNSN